ncbi:ABC-three component system middle component 8 [Geothrix sp. SG200]|uniref:ABC-three component system middle component 8 n=1 Tax=Geothrix sp. SG200 TaxID=2922865 RepID=UPI00325FCF21
MLSPSKHSHPDRTVINVAAILLSRLKNRRLEDYGALKRLVKKNVSGGDVLLLPALNLLFLLGLVEYRPKTDAFEYLGSNETI